MRCTGSLLVSHDQIRGHSHDSAEKYVWPPSQPMEFHSAKSNECYKAEREQLYTLPHNLRDDLAINSSGGHGQRIHSLVEGNSHVSHTVPLSPPEYSRRARAG